MKPEKMPMLGMRHERVHSLNRVDEKTNMMINTTRRAYEAFIRSRNHEKMCPFPGRYQQVEDSLQFFDCICQHLQLLGRVFLQSGTLTLSPRLFALSDHVLARVGSAEYLLRGISSVVTQSEADGVTKLYGRIDLVPDEYREVLITALSNLMFNLENVLKFVQTEDEQIESDKFCANLKSHLSSLFKSYNYVQRNLLQCT